MNFWKKPEQKRNELRLYNSLTKRKDVFVSRDGNTVKWYICGPTVYDSAHLGHARTYVSFDVVRRVLQNYFKYNVTYVMNITDIDDKIIEKANQLKSNKVSGDDLTSVCHEVSSRYEKEFFEDIDSLFVMKPTIITRVTDYVTKINQVIEKLVDEGYAYESNGSVYFDVTKYSTKRNVPIFVPECAIDRGSDRSDSNESVQDEKKDKRDFALWKKVDEGDFGYQSRWGYGRPGWHIECTSMSIDLLGELDIHAGGIDLRFPHHENEILQSQAYLESDQWTNYFLHTGHLHINGRKMSKSLKNFITIKEALTKYTARAIRLFFLMHNWCDNVDYSESSMEYAKNVESIICNFLSVFRSMLGRDEIAAPEFDRDLMGTFCEFFNEVHDALSDNIDTKRVVRILLEMISFANKNIKRISNGIVKVVYDYVIEICDVMGLMFKENELVRDEERVAEVFCKFRNNVRKFAKKGGDVRGLFTLCDEARDDAKDVGYLVEDNGDDSVIRRIL